MTARSLRSTGTSSESEKPVAQTHAHAPNNREEFARVARPTRKGDAPLLAAHAGPHWTLRKCANTFASSTGKPYSMTSYAKSTEQLFAADGGVGRVPTCQEDPFRALDDLMAVVEALCPTWPERRPFERTGDMRL